MKKKGFVLVETIIVTSILIISLMGVYTNFITSSNKEKTKLRYDDMADIYKVYYLKDYIENNTAKGVLGTDVPLNQIGWTGSESAKEYINGDGIKKMDGYQTITGCPIPLNEIQCSNLKDGNIGLCSALAVDRIYVIRFCYLDRLKEYQLASSFSSCFYGDADLADYVKKMGITNVSNYGKANDDSDIELNQKDKYQLIVKFRKNLNNGQYCTGDNCVYSYASININMKEGYDEAKDDLSCK
ncbi:MAG: hypothetical protein IJ574_01865 [Bacilli bacterium]|nr:hypothetical protein [Bacilli bacterium]